MNAEEQERRRFPWRCEHGARQTEFCRCHWTDALVRLSERLGVATDAEMEAFNRYFAISGRKKYAAEKATAWKDWRMAKKQANREQRTFWLNYTNQQRRFEKKWESLRETQDRLRQIRKALRSSQPLEALQSLQAELKTTETSPQQ